MTLQDNPPVGPLKDPKQEAFVLGLLSGQKHDDAYLNAGYQATQESASVLASRLLSDVQVSGRLRELMDSRASRVVLSREWLQREMIDASLQAKDDREHSPRIRALELLGREKGTFTERKDIAIRSFASLSAEEIEEMLDGEPGASAPSPKREGKGTPPRRAGKKKARGKKPG